MIPAGTDDMREITEEHLLQVARRASRERAQPQDGKEGYFGSGEVVFRPGKAAKEVAFDPSADVIIEVADDGKKMRGMNDEEAIESSLRRSVRSIPGFRPRRRGAPLGSVAVRLPGGAAQRNHPIEGDRRSANRRHLVRGHQAGGGPREDQTSVRVVPIHPHLIEMGFLKFVKAGRAEGAYSIRRTARPDASRSAILATNSANG